MSMSEKTETFDMRKEKRTSSQAGGEELRNFSTIPPLMELFTSLQASHGQNA